jgi:predicted double-glycine peptidase
MFLNKENINNIMVSQIKSIPDDSRNKLELTKLLTPKKLDISHVKQTNTYNCGPAVLQVLGVRMSLEKLEKLCKTTKRDGTLVKDLMVAAGELGYEVESKQDSVINDITAKIDEGTPVAVLFTHYRDPLPGFVHLPNKLLYAWEDTLQHNSLRHPILQKSLRILEEGHYSVVIGYNEKELILLDVETGKEKFTSKDDFEKMWYGEKVKSNRINRWMMTLKQKEG